MDLNYIEKNGEKIVLFCPYGKNRSSKVLEYNQKIFNKFNIPVNYIEYPFPACTHGEAIDHFVNLTQDLADYWIMIDIDIVPLRKDIVDIYYDKIKDKNTIISTCGQSNHLLTKNNDYNHPYCYGSGLGIPKELWLKLGKPSFNHNNNSDTAENITFKCEELGYNICFIWPRKVVGLTDEQCDLMKMDRKYKKSKVGCFEFGYQTTYGDLWFHCMFANCPDHEMDFIKKCEEILNG